jgi:hypothetical protein
MRLVDSVASTLVEARLEEHGSHNQKSHGRKLGTVADNVMAGGDSVNYIGRRPKSGFMVGGVVKSKVLPATATRAEVRDAVREFVDQHRATLKQPGMYLGGWKDDDGTYWIDISQRLSTLSAARSIGQTRNEIAVYSVRSGNSIDIGGTGNAE